MSKQILAKFYNHEQKPFGWQILVNPGERVAILPIDETMHFITDEQIFEIKDLTKSPEENQLNQPGKTTEQIDGIVFITTDTDYIYQHATKVLICNEEKILVKGTPDELFRDKELMNVLRLQKPKVIQTEDIFRYFGLLNKDEHPVTKKDWKKLFDEKNRE